METKSSQKRFIVILQLLGVVFLSISSTAVGQNLGNPFLAPSKTPAVSKEGQSAFDDLKMRQGSSAGEKAAEKEKPELTEIKNKIKRSFEYGRDWKERIKASGKGGGAVDGGGGNLSDGKLLDKVTHSRQDELIREYLLSVMTHHYSERFQSIEKAQPGFTEWLKDGLSLKWYADDKTLDSELCKNSQVHQVSQEIVACQTLREVRLKTSLISNSGDTDALADIIVHELVRYHVIRLGRMTDMGKEDQDSLVSETTYKILSADKTVDGLYSHLVESGLIPDEATMRIQVLKNYAFAVKSLSETVNSLVDLSNQCDEVQDPRVKNLILDSAKGRLNFLITASNFCKKWIDPEIGADGASCEKEETREKIISLFAKSCGNLTE